jgi:hypothetical protein
MNDIPDIITSKIVHTDWDVFWNELTENLPQKSVLIITTPIAADSNEEVQLKKILQACALTENEYNILQVNNNQLIAWNKIREQANPKTILLFGVLPHQLGISALFRLHEVNRFNDCLWIPSISLTELEKFPQTKKHLWTEAFKPVFIDKIYQQQNS